MATCCTPGCDNELSPNARLRTCVNCRAHGHRWDKRRPAERLDYSRRLRLYNSRMRMFYEVTDDDVKTRDHATLEEKRLLSFPVRKAKERAKANVVAFKLRNKKRA